MFKILLQIVLILYIIFLFFNIMDLKKYNVNGFIKTCSDEDEAKQNILNLNPILLNHENDYEINEVIIDKDTYIENLVFEERDYIEIDNDKSLLRIIDRGILPSLLTQRHSKITQVNNESISIYKNNQGILKNCYSNNTIIYIVDGDTTLYLFNPKHKDEIKDKQVESIKKWAHIKKLQKGDYLIIPTNWLYFLETGDKCILYNNKVNNIFNPLG